MNWNMRIRQVHRWLSIIFTLAVLVNLAALAQAEPAMWIGFLALFPLILLLISGLYLFALPYLARQRREESQR
jgi:membrane protein YdbS with pleckstrin-like domain